ncbi:MAG: PQQ-binding-like beta-propeller repeat protein [Planctomycetota bacterium]
MKHILFLVLLTILTLHASAQCDETVSSGGYRGPDRNGIYPAENLLEQWPQEGLKLLWTYDDLGPGWASATIYGDTVYCIGGAPNGNLFALDLETGKLKFKEYYGKEFTSRFDGTRSTPSVAEGKVVFSSGKKDERSIYCLDAKTGKTIWHVDGNKAFGGASQGWGYNESPLIVGDKVVFMLRAKDRTTPPVVALDLETGKKVWAADPGPGDLSAGDNSISLIRKDGKTVLVAHLWRAILGLDPETGKTLWSIKISKGTIVTPSYHDGYMAIGSYGGSNSLAVLKVDDPTKQPTELWKGGIDGISQVVTYDGKVFGLGQVVKDKKKSWAWKCFDAQTGKLIEAIPCMSDGSVVAADGMIFFVEGGERNWKQARIGAAKVTESGMEKIGSFQPLVGSKELWVSPTISAGRLFIRHGTRLSCYDLRRDSY